MPDKPRTPLNIDLSVKVSDGSFETKLSFPVDAAKEQRDWIVQSWLKAMEIAVKGAGVSDAARPQQSLRD